jgi:hypothetical protein
MRQLSTLKREASKTTSWRGHRLRWGEPFGNGSTNIYSQTGTCQNCKMTATLSMNGKPDIYGDAVALNCEGKVR